MTVEMFIIRLRDGTTQREIGKLIGYVKAHGGRVETLLKHGSVLIGIMDSSLADNVRNLPSVALVGGVVFKGREVRKIVKRTK